MTAVDILHALEELTDDDFEDFKWYLQQSDILEGYQKFKVSKLEKAKAKRRDIVSLMVNGWKLDGALKMTKKVLCELNRNDLVESLPDTSSGTEVDVSDGGETSENRKPSSSQCEGLHFEREGEREKRVEPHRLNRWKTDLRKYSCELMFNMNTINKQMKLSDNNRTVTHVKEDQSYLYHPDRFDECLQLLCRNYLTDRCYWEVEWQGEVFISVSYRGISRRGNSCDSLFGQNDQSWSLECTFRGYHVWHNKTATRITPSSTSSSSVSSRVGVYVDCPAGILSFYDVSSDTQTHLHTFNTTFTEPLYPGFGLRPRRSMMRFSEPFGSLVSLCSLGRSPLQFTCS